MYRSFTMAFLVSCLLLVCACAKESGRPAEKKAANVHGPGLPADTVLKTMADELKGQKLANYQAETIGKAFDEYPYFVKREWQQARGANGKFYIDFTGWFDPRTIDSKAAQEGITSRGVQIKFVVNPGGDFYVGMISVVGLKSNGEAFSRPLTDDAQVLSDIYAHRIVIL